MIARSETKWPVIAAIHTIIFDFDGVFTDNKVYVSEDGHESVQCDRRDGLAIDLLRRYKRTRGIAAEFFILSTERNPVVAARARKMGLDCRASVGNKLQFVTDYLKERVSGNDPFAGLVYLGNDLNDLLVLERAGFSIVPADSHDRVRRVANAVLLERGGHGFVRAAVEKLLQVETMTTEEIHELVCDR